MSTDCMCKKEQDSIEDSVDASVQLEDWIKNAEEDWLERPKIIDKISINRTKMTRKQ